jgi:Ca2+-binding RTX toxin-like protein
MSIIDLTSGQTYATLSDAITASAANDVIQISAGTYPENFPSITHSLTIEATGGIAYLTNLQPDPPNGRAVIDVPANLDVNLTLSGLDISGAVDDASDPASVGGANGAGILFETGNGALTVIDSHIHGNEDGILTGGANAYSTTGMTVTIEDSEIDDNGVAASNSRYGYDHNIYVGAVNNFTITNSYVHDALGGNEIKSLALASTIENNRIFDNTAAASYEIDLSDGGRDVVTGNIIQKGPNSPQEHFADFGAEATYAGSTLNFSDNTLIDDGSPALLQNGAIALYNATKDPVTGSIDNAAISDDTFYGITAPYVYQDRYGPPYDSVTGGAFLPLSDAPTLNTASLFAAPGTPQFAESVTGETVLASGSIMPFAAVAITDPNGDVTDSVTVTLSNPAAGMFSNIIDGGYNAASGVYTVSGPIAAVQNALQALVFTPVYLATAPGASATVDLAASLDDGIAPRVNVTSPLVISNPLTALPDVSGSLTASALSLLQRALSGAMGSDVDDVVTTASGVTSLPAFAGYFNALVATGVAAGATVTVPTGFQAAYLTGGAGAALTDSVGGALLVATAANATLSGAADDTLIGGNGNTTIDAGAGAETLVGGSGANLIRLGAGNAVVVAQGVDTIIASSGGASITESGDALYFGGAGPTEFIATGAADTLVGGGDETINAGSASALVFGGAGSFDFIGGGGASTVVSGVGSAATVIGGGTGLLYFGNGTTTYEAGSAVDTVLGFTGSLTATGGANGTLFFTGTAGGSNVSTGAGSSTIFGFGANDTLTATGSGNDVIAATAAAETVDGAASSGQNTFFAFGANDVLIGGSGQTALESGLGNHTLIAGGGATLFEIIGGTAHRAITIGDFNPGRDYVQLQGYAAGTGAMALRTATVTNAGEILTLYDGTTITFQGVTNLTAASFVEYQSAG